jgi:D-amino-acid dehydrogenase
MKIAGAVYFPNDCHLPPGRFMHSMRQRLAKSGVEFRWSTEVTHFQRSGNRIEGIETAQGTLRGDEYVLCGGSWSSVIGQQLDLRLPMQAGKGYSLTCRSRNTFRDLRDLMRSACCRNAMGDTLRFGGTMEIAGLNEHIIR